MRLIVKDRPQLFKPISHYTFNPLATMYARDIAFSILALPLSELISDGNAFDPFAWWTGVGEMVHKVTLGHSGCVRKVC